MQATKNDGSSFVGNYRPLGYHPPMWHRIRCVIILGKHPASALLSGSRAAKGIPGRSWPKVKDSAKVGTRDCRAQEGPCGSHPLWSASLTLSHRAEQFGPTNLGSIGTRGGTRLPEKSGSSHLHTGCVLFSLEILLTTIFVSTLSTPCPNPCLKEMRVSPPGRTEKS